MIQKRGFPEVGGVVGRIGPSEDGFDEHDESAAIRRWESMLGDSLRTAATQIAGEQPGLADDLYQEALIRLWELDPTRYLERDGGYLRKALYNRMVDVARVEERRRFWDPPASESAA